MKNTFKYLLILMAFSLPSLLHAQGLINNGASIVVKQGAEVVIDGDNGNYTNQKSGEFNGQLFLDGQMSLRGSWYNNADSTVFAEADSVGLVLIENSAKAIHELGGNGCTKFENLTVSSGNTAKIIAGSEIRVMYNFILNGTLEVNGDLYIEGCFTNNGTITGTGTVYYQSTEPQVVAPGSYPNLVLDNPGGLVMEDSVFVKTELVLSQGSLVLGEHNLVLGPDCEIIESKAPGTWVDATSTGLVIKMFDKVGTFEFPVGNFGSNPVYSPVSVEIISANFDDGQISVRLKPEVHPDNNTGPDFPDYLSRYWVVESEGLSDLSYNIRFDYAETDVVGNETEIEGAKFVDSVGLWKHSSHVNAVEHYFEASGLNSFSVFTGVQENRIPELAITYPTNGISYYDTTITITGTASDIDGDLRKVFLRINEGTWQLLDDKENWSLTVPLTFGNKKIEAKAVDFQDAESLTDAHTIFAGVQMITLYDRWSHFSAFLDPIAVEVETIMEYPVSQDLLNIMVNNSGGIYWPSQNINTMGDWVPGAAYKISINAQSEILFKGDLLEETSLQLSTGASYIPVLSNVEIPVEEAFGNPQEDILIMFNHITNEVYWPAGGIFTLQTLRPGHGYLANLINPATVSFPDYDLWASKAKTEVPVFVHNGPWPVTKTGEAHQISIFSEALAGLENASHIGAFNSMGDCIGFANITAKGQNNLLTVYGDDPYTAYKDGAEAGELISFRVYDPASGAETELVASYSSNFPNHEGLFSIGGLSAIVGFKEGNTGIGESSLASQISVYPNPAKEEVNISQQGFDPADVGKATLLSSDGKPMKTISINNETTRVSVGDLPPGIYILKIESKENTIFKRVVIQ